MLDLAQEESIVWLYDNIAELPFVRETLYQSRFRTKKPSRTEVSGTVVGYATLKKGPTHRTGYDRRVWILTCDDIGHATAYRNAEGLVSGCPVEAVTPAEVRPGVTARFSSSLRDRLRAHPMPWPVLQAKK